MSQSYYCGNPPPVVIEITPTIAGQIWDVLVLHANADPTLRDAFAHHVADTDPAGLHQNEFRLQSSYFGVTYWSVCYNEWVVRTSQEDESPRTQLQVDNTNLELALLRDIVLAALP